VTNEEDGEQLSYEKIKATRYLCTCEAKKRGSANEACGYQWETDSIPTVCAKCKSRRWNGTDKRTEHFLTHNGKTLSVAQWAEALGLKRMTIYQRIRRGWSIEDILDPGMFVAGRKPKDAQ